MKGEVNPGMASVRKLVSGRLNTQSAGPHPDADLLSAFAENALPEAERRHVLVHLADCGGCREAVFLSLPQPADDQTVLIPRPGRWRMRLRWGSAVASIVIIAGVFAARRELFRSTAPLAKSAAASQLPTKTTVAEEKIPAELVGTASRNQTVKAPLPVPETHVPERVRPDLKHMTAKMQGTLTFGKSDEVQVSPAPSPNFTADARAVRDFPVQGLDRAASQSAAAPKALTANATEEKDKSEVAVVAKNNQLTRVATGAGALAKPEALQPHLAGTVLDASGAVVPNAKVTTVGPIGTETVTSDLQGRFAFDVLTPGLYSVKADASGFKPVELKQVAIAANQSPSLKLTLAPGAATESVEVSGQSAVVESSAAYENISPNAVEARKKAQRQNTWNAPADNTVAGAVPALQWTLSPMGAVQSSNDGGKTWQMVAVVANTSFRALSAVGASVWVGGPGGILYHSPDAGHNWASVVPANQGQKLNSDITRIEFLDLREGTLSTSSGEIWITHDGGNTWEHN